MTSPERADRSDAVANADTAGATENGEGRRARLETRHARPRLVADAVAPDNTDSMATTVDGDRVVTTVERGTTGGLGSSVDDYVVNLTVAETVVADARDRVRTDAGSNADGTDDAVDVDGGTPTERRTDTTNAADTADTADDRTQQ